MKIFDLLRIVCVETAWEEHNGLLQHVEIASPADLYCKGDWRVLLHLRLVELCTDGEPSYSPRESVRFVGQRINLDVDSWSNELFGHLPIAS